MDKRIPFNVTFISRDGGSHRTIIIRADDHKHAQRMAIWFHRAEPMMPIVVEPYHPAQA